MKKKASDAPKGIVLSTRVSGEQLAKWRAAAERDRRKLTDWLRTTLDVQAEKANGS